jgi:hypothetical protein
MPPPSDPVEAEIGSTEDLDDVAEWEARTRLDRLAVAIHGGLRRSGRWVLIAVALLLFVAQLGFSGYAAIVRPTLGVLTLLSTVPAMRSGRRRRPAFGSDVSHCLLPAATCAAPGRSS